eukprot:scaffold45142_cov19-Prasinocladus_malaysianus.AAC.1
MRAASCMSIERLGELLLEYFNAVLGIAAKVVLAFRDASIKLYRAKQRTVVILQRAGDNSLPVLKTTTILREAHDMSTFGGIIDNFVHVDRTPHRTLACG